MSTVRALAVLRRSLATTDATRHGLGWPQPKSPEWLSLQRRPEGDRRGFFGIPADADDHARPPLELEKGAAADAKRAAAAEAADAAADARRAAERAAEKAAEARFDEAQRSNGSLVPPSTLAHAHPSVAARSASPAAAPTPTPRVQRLLDFASTPRDVKQALDARVVGQDAAKRAVAVARRRRNLGENDARSGRFLRRSMEGGGPTS